MAAPDDDFTAPMESRGMAGPFGKFTEPVKTHLDDHTLNLWLRLCARQDKASAELLRDIVYLVVHGKTPAEMSAQDTRALLSREGLNAVRNGSAT